MDIGEHSPRVRSLSKNTALIAYPGEPVPAPEWWFMTSWILGLDKMQFIEAKHRYRERRGRMKPKDESYPLTVHY